MKSQVIYKKRRSSVPVDLIQISSVGDAWHGGDGVSTLATFMCLCRR